MRNCLVNFFGDKRHKGVKQLQNIRKNIHKNCLCGFCTLAALKANLCNFNIPVAENIPNKIIKLLDCNAKLIFFKICGNILCQGVCLRNYPLILNCKLRGQARILIIIAEIHKHKSCGIPKLICKVSRSLNLIVRKAHIISG